MKKILIISSFFLALMLSSTIGYKVVSANTKITEVKDIITYQESKEDYLTYYNYTLDNGYIKLLLNYGLLATIFYGYIYNKTLKKTYLFNNYIVYFIILILLFFNVAESSMLYVYFNIFILYFFCKDSSKGEEYVE